MDPFTQKLLDRTRQRREDLAKKLQGTPATKRPSEPLQPNNSRNVPDNKANDVSPVKRQCFRQNETTVKPDTPAIQGVHSRMKSLVKQRVAWDVGDEDNAPSPIMHSKDPSPTPERPSRPSLGARKNRLAALAQTICNWEEDLNYQHPEEVTPSKSSSSTQDSSPAPPKPPRSYAQDSPKKSPKKVANSQNIAPKNETNKGSPSRLPRPARHEPPPRDRFVSPTKSSPSSNAPKLGHSGGSFISEAKLRMAPKKKDENEPTNKSVTSRLGMWEKRVQSTCNTPGGTPKKTTPTTTSTPAVKSPCRKPVGKSPQRPEPTDTPVNARMAAWEQKVAAEDRTPRSKPLKPLSSKMSFSEAIACRAMQFQDRQEEPQSPAEVVSPRAHEGLQGIQEKLYTKTHEGWKETDIAERCKTMREKDLEALKNRWKAGLKEEDYTVSSTPIQRDLDADDFNVPPHKPASPAYKGLVIPGPAHYPDEQPTAPPRGNGSKRKMTREETRQKKRDEFEDKLAALGFEAGHATNSPTRKCAKTRHISEDNAVHKQIQAESYQGQRARHQSAQGKTNQQRFHPSPLNTVTEEPVMYGQDQTPTQELNEMTPRQNMILDPMGGKGQSAHQKIWTRVKTFDAGNDDDVPLRRRKRESEMMAMQNQCESDSEEEEDDVPKASTSSTTVVEKVENMTCETTVTVNSKPDSSKTVTIQRKFLVDPDSQDEESIQTETASQASENYPDCESDFSEDEDFRKPRPQSVWSDTASSSLPSSLGVEPLESSDRDMDSDMMESVQNRMAHYLSTSQNRYDHNMDYRIDHHLPSSGTSSSRPSQETETETSYDSNNSAGTDDLCAEMDDMLEENESDEESFMDRKSMGTYNCRTRTQEYKPSTKYKSPSPKKVIAEKQIVYNVDMYRSTRHQKNRPAPKITVVRRGNTPDDSPESLPFIPEKSIKQKIQELHDLVKQEQSVIIQTSNALNKCCSKNSTFAGSLEQVECNRVLLIACQKRQAYIEEIDRLKKQPVPKRTDGCKGSLTINDIRLPLKKDFVTKLQTRHDTAVHFFMCILKNGPHILVTQMVSTHDGGMRGTLELPNMFRINDLTSGFSFSLDVYSMSVIKEAEPDKKKSKFTPKKIFGKGKTSQTPDHSTGAMSVRTTNFSFVASVPITLRSIHNVTFNLQKVPFLSPLQGLLHMKLRCVLDSNVEEKGFLTMFEDVTGLGNWYRRWCVLANNQIRFWKYPDDEFRREPMGCIDLKNCVSEHIGLIPRDICARPNTFELTVVRPQRSSDKNTLVSWSYDTMTSTRHMLSADTKEDRFLWCDQINQALKNIRTWQSDALQPIRAQKRVI